MPPRIPGSSLSSITKTANFRVSLSFHTYMKTYPFVNPQNVIPPESPDYVRVPKAPQSDPVPKQVVKGTLPPPRNVFHRRAGDKTSKEFLDATIPEPESQTESTNEYVKWKRRMAESRRKNLRESIADLHKRKIEHTRKVVARSQNRSNYRERLVNKPQREDERLTSPTVTMANSWLQKGVLPDPNREARIAAKRAKVEAIEAARKEARKDALHTLYMNARNFITTEDELEAKIEEIFVPEPHEKGNANDNIWLVKHAPPTVKDLLESIKREEKGTVDYYAGERPAIATGRRIKKIAEELTGGKMD